MYIIELGEVNNRKIVAYSKSKEFRTRTKGETKINFMDSITGQYPQATILISPAIRQRLLDT